MKELGATIAPRINTFATGLPYIHIQNGFL